MKSIVWGAFITLALVGGASAQTAIQRAVIEHGVRAQSIASHCPHLKVDFTRLGAHMITHDMSADDFQIGGRYYVPLMLIASDVATEIEKIDRYRLCADVGVREFGPSGTRLANVLVSAQTGQALVVAQSNVVQRPAAQGLTASAFDVFTDPDAYKNKRVTVTGCQFFNAKTSTVNCAVRSPRGAQVGNILVALRTLDAPMRRRVLTDCAGDGSDIAEACERVTVTGRFTIKYGSVFELVSPTIVFD